MDAEEWSEPSSRSQAGKASSRQSPHICVCGRPTGPELRWLTAVVMGLLEIRTALQPRPSGPGPNHTVTCTALCFQESFLSPLVLHNALPSLGPLASFPLGEGPPCPMSLATGWPILSCALQHCFSSASPTCWPLPTLGGCSLGQHWVCQGFWWDSPDKLDLGACTAAWSCDTSSWLHPLLAAL